MENSRKFRLIDAGENVLRQIYKNYSTLPYSLINSVRRYTSLLLTCLLYLLTYLKYNDFRSCYKSCSS